MKLIKPRLIILSWSFLCMVLSVSCTSSNYLVGTDQTRFNLNEQREASRTILVFDTMPEGYALIGPVDAARCHRDFFQETPSRELVLIDLKVTAYARGADALCDVSITKKSALLKNCWYMLDGRAKMLRKITNK